MWYCVFILSLEDYPAFRNVSTGCRTPTAPVLLFVKATLNLLALQHSLPGFKMMKPKPIVVSLKNFCLKVTTQTLESIYFSGKSDMMFFIFVTFICCCGLALILLTIFLWRKYTRAGGALAANCDTFIQQEQQQHLVSVCALLLVLK